MLYKVILWLLVLVGMRSEAWALTPHADYATLDIAACNECHLASQVAPTHGATWGEEHRLVAEKQPTNCQDCHQQSFCLDCHVGGALRRDLHRSRSGVDVMPRSHRTDFRELHPIQAFNDPQSCLRCHDQRRFCAACHQKFNPTDLRVLSHRKGFSNLEVRSAGPQHATFTPDQCQRCHPNSLLPKHVWSASHAREARKNLATCQACHPEGNVCLQCHSATSGLRINPHPKDWGRIADRLKRASDNRTCIRCHR